MAKFVLVKGGGEYKLAEQSTGYVVWSPGLLRHVVGEARSMEDALALVKHHSGREIKAIR